eukprot:m.68575 g.68575  ORF g.68575 m.68575 type:complete len:295 (+) comp16002_c0_seq1:382-1266(+)
MTRTHRLFLLDGLALVYRAYFARVRNPAITSFGQDVSAVFGFANSLRYLLQYQQPTHIAVAFDTPEPTIRHRQYAKYKAHRKPVPDALSSSVPVVKDLLDAMRITVVEMPGYEADDVIGTLAKQAELLGGYDTYMVTPDKDFAQLVSPSTYILKPGTKGVPDQILGVDDICEQWGIQSPEQVVEILALWGDATDNIPGVPGIGQVRSRQLIGKYGSVDNLLASIDELQGKQKQNVEQYAAQARLSRSLATIDVAVPIDVNVHDLGRQPPDTAALHQLYTDLEFQSFMEHGVILP